MLPECLNFRKTLSQRKKEYNCLFNLSDQCTNIHRFWAFDLELVFSDYNNGNWQCLWQMSEESCTEYNTLHPNTVIVKIQEIIFEELSAIVTVEGVQDDVSFPDQISLPLIELFPTKEQCDIPLPVVRNVSDWLDRCRFFFLHLWYPWDSYDDCLISEWAHLHLDNRLKLQYDIRDGNLDVTTSHYIESIIAEAVQIVDFIENNEDRDLDDDKKMLTLKSLIRKETIKMELNFFETPELRGAMMKYMIENKNNSSFKNALVTVPAECSAICQFVNEAKSLLNADTKTHISDSPSEVVKTISSGSSIILSEGTHYFSDLGNLAYGGEIKGVSENADIVMKPKVLTPQPFIFLNCFNSITFESVIIKRCEGVLLNCSQGTLTLKSCSLDGGGGCGIMIQPCARLEMINCRFNNLSSGIIAKNKSTLILKSTSFYHCSEGIKVMEEAHGDLFNVQIKESTVAALVLLSSKGNFSSGGIEILQDVDNFRLNQCVFENNKVDALIDSI